MSDSFTPKEFLEGKSVYFAGTANSIMQLGWPAVGYGVVESTVDSGNVMKVPRKRLRTTATYLSVAWLGTDAEGVAYRSAVNGAHRQVRSNADSPVKYNAFDPELQLWVAACLYYGAKDFHERLHGPIPVEVADQFYCHARRFGTTLQVRDEHWPVDRAAFDAYWRQATGKVSYDETLKTYLNGLLDLKQLPPTLQAKHAGFHRWVNTGFLPPEFRDALGLVWTAEDSSRHQRVCESAGARNRSRPQFVRNFPYNYFLWDFRVRRMLRRRLV